MFYIIKAQKDLLDTELDLYNAASNGENATGLKRKLILMKAEVSPSRYQLIKVAFDIEW